MSNEKSKPPAFQFYVNDFLGSGDVEAMTDKEFRAYVNLLARCWHEDPAGSLPDDDRRLAAMSRIGKQGWKSAGPAVRRKFEKRGARLFNSKLEKQAKALAEFVEKQSRAGSESAKRRWGKNEESIDNQMENDNGRITDPSARLQPNGNSSSSSSPSGTTPTPPARGTNGGMDKGGETAPNPVWPWIPGISSETPRDPDGMPWCYSCNFPYAPGENDDNHSCTRALIKAGQV